MNDKKQGIIYIIMAGFFFALMTFFVRMSGDLPTMQKAFFRNAVAAVAAVILLAKSDEGFKIKRIAGRGFFCEASLEQQGLYAISMQLTIWPSQMPIFLTNCHRFLP